MYGTRTPSARVADRWAELRRHTFAPQVILPRIDELAKQLNEAQKRAADILKKHRERLEKLRDEVLKHKSIEKERIAEIIAEFRKEQA